MLSLLYAPGPMGLTSSATDSSEHIPVENDGHERTDRLGSESMLEEPCNTACVILASWWLIRGLARGVLENVRCSKRLAHRRQYNCARRISFFCVSSVSRRSNCFCSLRFFSRLLLAAMRFRSRCFARPGLTEREVDEEVGDLYFMISLVSLLCYVWV